MPETRKLKRYRVHNFVEITLKYFQVVWINTFYNNLYQKWAMTNNVLRIKSKLVMSLNIKNIVFVNSKKIFF